MAKDMTHYMNGTPLPMPSSFEVEYAMFVENAIRDAQGFEHHDVVRENVRKLYYTWAHVKRAELSTLLQLLSRDGVLSYPDDPLTNGRATIDVYPGNRKLKTWRYKVDGAEYIDLTCNIIEK